MQRKISIWDKCLAAFYLQGYNLAMMKLKLPSKLPRLVLFDERGLDAPTIRSLKLMIYAVAFGVIQFNIVGGIAMAGYLRELGASDFVFGLLFAIGPIISPMQLFASYLLELTRKRKHMFIIAGLIQRIVWLPFGLIPFFIPMEQMTLRIWMVTIFLMVSAFSGPFMNVSFFSLAADLVPEHIRGRYFAVRMRVSTVCGILGGVVTAWILDNILPFHSYTFVFTLAAIMGTLDILCFFGIKFPEMAKRPKDGDGFLQMLGAVIKNKPYMRFIFFMTFWLFSVNIAGPFILVHLREGVQLSNTLITVAVQILPNLCSVFMAARWGRTLDSHGNKPTMQVANGILCIAPFLWIFTGNYAFSIVLIMIIGIMQGALLPGFDLGANNIMLGHAPKVNRSMFIAVYFMCTSIIGIGLANATGGWLLDNVFSTFEGAGVALVGVTLTRYSYLFALTALLRCIMVYVALPRLVKEENGTSASELVETVFKGMKRRWLRRWAFARYRMRRK